MAAQREHGRWVAIQMMLEEAGSSGLWILVPLRAVSGLSVLQKPGLILQNFVGRVAHREVALTTIAHVDARRLLIGELVFQERLQPIRDVAEPALARGRIFDHANDAIPHGFDVLLTMHETVTGRLTGRIDHLIHLFEQRRELVTTPPHVLLHRLTVDLLDALAFAGVRPELVQHTARRARAAGLVDGDVHVRPCVVPERAHHAHRSVLSAAVRHALQHCHRIFEDARRHVGQRAHPLAVLLAVFRVQSDCITHRLAERNAGVHLYDVWFFCFVAAAFSCPCSLRGAPLPSSTLGAVRSVAAGSCRLPTSRLPSSTRAGLSLRASLAPRSGAPCSPPPDSAGRLTF
jgi:hypothetical protein